MSGRATLLPIIGLLLAGVTTLGGCYRPEGALLAYTGAAQTYFSTATQPKTVRLTDTRSDEVVFSMDIPPGKQLTLQFKADEGDDPVYSPDLMVYQIFDLGKTTGKLRSSMSVPSASARRVDIYLRPAPEYAADAGLRTLRTDELVDRPDWWTPEGGELPEDRRGVKNYHN